MSTDKLLFKNIREKSKNEKLSSSNFYLSGAIFISQYDRTVHKTLSPLMIQCFYSITKV